MIKYERNEERREKKGGRVQESETGPRQKISWRPKEIVEKGQVSRDIQQYAWLPTTLPLERSVPTA